MFGIQIVTFIITFLLGLIGILFNRRDILIVLVSVELMLLAVGLLSITFSVHLDDIVGQILAIFILTVAAAESAVGLGILIQYYRIKGNISLSGNSVLRG
jgi:NADH-quinone oxidoreductase subunit K